MSQHSKPYMTGSYRWIAGSRQEVCVSFLALCVCPDPIYFIRPGLAHKRGTLVNASQSQTDTSTLPGLFLRLPWTQLIFPRSPKSTKPIPASPLRHTETKTQSKRAGPWGLANMPCTGRNTQPNSSSSSCPWGERLKLAHDPLLLYHLARETSRKDLICSFCEISKMPPPHTLKPSFFHHH